MHEQRHSATGNPKTMTRIVLLFLHGGSYTKECWNPIIKRLQQSPLLQRVSCETVTIDWRFHGEKSDHSVEATLSYLDGDKAKPRVDHPLRVWADWGLDDLRNEVSKLRSHDRADTQTKVVGIGHSMGASAMLQVEMQTPGTFQGIVAFEPVFGKTTEEAEVVSDTIVPATMRRPGEWTTWDDVLDHFRTGRMYRRWHPESLDAFLQQGVRQRRDGTFVLAVSPLQEASIYCHRVKPPNFATVKCPVTIEYAEKSLIFDVKSSKQLAQAYPTTFSMAEAMRNTTHSMVMEDPDTCAAHILIDLERLPFFQPHAKL